MSAIEVRVLLVEDNPGDARLIKEYLRESEGVEPYILTTAARLDEALHLLDTQSFDVILLDLSLPDAHGLETVTALGERIFRTPVIVITGLTDVAVATDAVRAGAQDYLVKSALTSELLVRSIRYGIERTKLRAELAKREAQYRLLAENVTDIIARHAPDSTLRYVSPSCRALLGYEPQALIGHRVDDFLHPDDLPILNAVRDASQRTLNTYTISYRFRHQDGSYRWLESTGNVVRDPSTGFVQETVSVSRDITERKKNAEDLQEAERFARSTVDALSAHIAILDESGTILAVNQGWREFAQANQASGNESVGANYLTICDESARTGSDEARAFAAGLREVIHRENETFELEYPCHSPTEQRWFVARVTRFPGAGPVRIVVAHENITARKQAEQRLIEERSLLRTLIDNMPDYIYAKDSQSRLILSNKAQAALVGVTTPEATLGKTDYDFFERAQAEQFFADEQAILQSGQALVNQEETVTDSTTGRQIYLETTKVPLRDSDGRFIGIVGIGRDITKRRLSEQTARKNAALLAQMERVAQIGAWELDLETMGLTWTEEVYRIHELDLSYRPTLPEAIAFYTPTAAPIIEQAVQRAIERAESFDLELELITAKGNHRWVHAVGIARQQENEFGTVFGTIEDITERRRANEALHFQAQLLDTVGQAVIATNRDNQIIYWNRFAESLYGWSPKEAIGHDIVEITPSDATREQANEIMTRLRDGESWSGEFMVQHKDGTTFPVLVTDTPIVDESGEQIGIIGVSMDISERKRAEQALHRYNQRIEILHSIDQCVVTGQPLQNIVETIAQSLTEVTSLRCHSAHKL